MLITKKCACLYATRATCLASFDRRERFSEFCMVPLASEQVPRLAIGD